MTDEKRICLSCGSSRVVQGTIESRGPIEKRAMFYATDSKMFKFTTTGPYIPIPREGALFCIACGLSWNTVSDLDSAREILMSWGTDELKAFLDIGE